MFKFLLQILKDECGTTLAITRKTANTLITAAGFNTNYDEIESVCNALTSDNLSDDSVRAAALHVDVVRAGYGISQYTDGSLYVDLSDANPALELTDGGLRVKVDDSSIERVSGGLQVKALGITNAMLAGLIDLAAKVTGTLPVGNGGTGTTAAANAPNGVVVLDSSSKIPTGILNNNLSITQGNCTHGDTISPPTGFTMAQCKLILTPFGNTGSIQAYPSSGQSEGVKANFGVTTGASYWTIISRFMGDTDGSWVDVLSTYTIIGIK